MEFKPKYDPIRESSELRNQLSASKRLGFFFGAGTSMALGIPGISELTIDVQNILENKSADFLKGLSGSLGCNPNIEDLLNQIRLIRQITKESAGKSYDGITGADAKKLDIDICDAIYGIISKKEESLSLDVPKKFAMWYNWISRNFSKEIFTTNYDLVLERAFESLFISYYDGFVGANEPFFLPESLEPENRLDYPPVAWIRMWKLHGSLNWYWLNGGKSSSRIVRLGIGAKIVRAGDELVIYPSREKYDSSRKQPFIAYFDRLKNYLLESEALFIVSGYSFQDEHINAVLLNGLKSNNRLHVLALMFSDAELERVAAQGQSYPNLTLFGPTKAVIGGLGGSWIAPTTAANVIDSFWDSTKKVCRLGDFSVLVNFLLECSGKREKIEHEVANAK